MSAIPTHEALIARLDRANRWGRWFVALELALIVVLAAVVDWNLAVAEPFLPAVSAALVAGPFVKFLVMRWGQNKKEIGDLREQTKFGEFDKHVLRSMCQDTLCRLGLPERRLPVYITADKSLNASAMRPGLASIFLSSLHGIYLNRQVLHKLTRAEVQDIMGHELGHYYRYWLTTDRYRELTYVLGTLTGIVVAQQIGLTIVPTLLAMSGVAWAFGWLLGWPLLRHGKAIEYLCDALGAQVFGVATSIQGLLKLGLDSETRYAIQRQALFSSPSGDRLNAAEILAAVEAAFPYGSYSHEELQAMVDKEVAARNKARHGLSLSGLVQFAWRSDDEDQEEALQEMRLQSQKLDALPRLNWEAIVGNPDKTALDDEQLEQLVELIDAFPNQMLFRLPEEIGEGDGVHPPLRRRIQFLWQNRAEIAAAARAVRR